jgi:hypothetical protein
MIEDGTQNAAMTCTVFSVIEIIGRKIKLISLPASQFLGADNKHASINCICRADTQTYLSYFVRSILRAPEPSRSACLGNSPANEEIDLSLDGSTPHAYPPSPIPSQVIQEPKCLYQHWPRGQWRWQGGRGGCRSLYLDRALDPLAWRTLYNNGVDESGTGPAQATTGTRAWWRGRDEEARCGGREASPTVVLLARLGEGGRARREVADPKRGHGGREAGVGVARAQARVRERVTHVGARRLGECRRFETEGSLSRRVNVPRAPAQMGRARRGSEVAGDGRERGGNPAAFVFVPRPVGCACSRGLQASTRVREASGPKRASVSPSSPCGQPFLRRPWSFLL